MHLAAKQMALPIKMGLISLILFSFFGGGLRRGVEDKLGEEEKKKTRRRIPRLLPVYSVFLILTSAEQAGLCVQRL